jgi:LPXTG-site transpeptidase (sortase) family protein
MLSVRTRPVLAVAFALVMTAVGAASSVAYIGQAQIQILLSGPSTVRCNRSATISARVVSTEDGRPVRNQVVSWSLTRSQSSGDGLSSSRTVTDRRGRTGVTLSFGPAAGSRTVRASANVTSPSITVRCAGGLPKTAARPPIGYVEEPTSALFSPPAIAEDPLPVLPATRVSVPRLGIDLPIVEGDGVSVPEDAAAHYPGTAWPDQGSNMYVYAHAREGRFLELWDVRTGDIVDVDKADGEIAQYRVSQVLPLVAYDDLDMLAPTDHEILTLQTCLSYDETAPRFVVIAERVFT